MEVVDHSFVVHQLPCRYRWPIGKVRKCSQSAGIGLIEIHPVKNPGVGTRVPDPCSLSSTSARLVHAGFLKFLLQAPQYDSTPRSINDGVNAFHNAIMEN